MAKLTSTPGTPGTPGIPVPGEAANTNEQAAAPIRSALHELMDMLAATLARRILADSRAKAAAKSRKQAAKEE